MTPPGLDAPVCSACDKLDCYCTLPEKPAGSSVVTGYTSGSEVSSNVTNTQIPDNLTVTDYISCTDSCTGGNTSEAESEVGTRTFSIQGSIAVSEKFNSKGGSCNEGRQKSNACRHSEQRTELVPNSPAPGNIPCACLPQ